MFGRLQISGRLVLALFVPAFGLYILMVFVTLSHLSTLGGRLRVFDMMPSGYNSTYAVNLLESLGEEGRQYYLFKQIPLDLLYPFFFAASMFALSNWLATKFEGFTMVFRRIAFLAPVAGAFDYLENGFIVLMLTSFPQISPNLVQWASGASIAKSGLTTLFFCLLIVVVILATVSRRFRKSRE